MDNLIELFITTFLGFFAIMNPVSNAAVFVGLTSSMSSTQQRSTAMRSLITAFFIIVVFSLLGSFIFDMFGISLPALRLGGGILVFLIGFKMLQGGKSRMHHSKKEEVLTKPEEASEEKQNEIILVDEHDAKIENDEEDDDIAISPLALPLLAGPGSITTAMNYSASGHIMNSVVTIVSFFVLCVITYFCFIYGPKLMNAMGKSAIGLVSRLMGLILVVIGTQMEIHGVFDTILLWQKLHG